MIKKLLRGAGCGVVVCLCALYPPPCHAALVSAGTTVTGNDVVLDSITTSEGVFAQADLVNVQVTHFKGSSGTWIVRPTGAAVPPVGNRAAQLEDFSLSTGTVNPGGSDTNGITAPPVTNATDPANNTSGLEFIFDTPIFNVAGQVDLVLFEIGLTTQSGDPFALSLLDGSAQAAYDSTDYSVTVGATSLTTATGTPPDSLFQLENNSLSNGTPNNFNARGIGIDLSDLGLADGAVVTGLFLTGGNIDPTLIVGLHAVPEPSAICLGIFAAGGICGLVFVRRGRANKRE